MKREADLPTVRKAVYGISPPLIYEDGLAPMEAMAVSLYELGFRNVEVSDMMTALLNRPISRQMANDYRRRGTHKLGKDEEETTEE